MKVLVLGATGRAGKAAVLHLLGMEGIERVYLADRDAEALSKLAAGLGHLQVSPRFLDAENARGLRERMMEADLVLGCLGPFHRHEGMIVEAAIATRRDYISLCDDLGAATEAFSLGAEAESEGVRVLCGCGLTPGLSNLLACRACSRLDKIDDLQLAWYLDVRNGLGSATLEHIMHAFGTRVVLHERGGMKEARAGSREELVEFPPPVGWKTVGFMGHPEPSTVPYSLGGIPDVYFKAGVGEKGRGLALQWLAWLGEGGRKEPWETALHYAARGIAGRGGDPCLTALRVTARGMREGAGHEIILAAAGGYYALSGRVLAAAVEHWRHGQWPPGVYPPEKVLDNQAFFTLLYRRGVRILVGEDQRYHD